MPDDMLETAGQDLDEARAKIVAARQTLQEAPRDTPEIRQDVTRLERMEAELARVEEAIMIREGLR
jgi:hypothetical protein